MIEIYQLFQFLGGLYLIIGIGMLINPALYIKIMEDVVKNSSMMLVSGMISFTLGFVFISSASTSPENIWETIILILGVMGIVKAVALLAFPSLMGKMLEKAMCKHLIMFTAIMSIIVALLFLYVGFVGLVPQYL